MLEEIGELEEAEATRRAGLDAARDVHGDEHPQTLVALAALARLVGSHDDRLDEAEASITLALTLTLP